MICDKIQLNVNHLTRHVTPANSPCGIPENNQIKSLPILGSLHFNKHDKVKKATAERIFENNLC